MFSKHIRDIITEEHLLSSLKAYTKHPHHQAVSQLIHNGKLVRSIQSGSYIPDASYEVDIPKHDGTNRTIHISTLLDRVVAKTIATQLSTYFRFSDRSYAYRPNKGPVKAVRRILDDIKRGHRWVLRTDIEHFFDRIDQTRLSHMLQKHIADKRLITLMLLFVKKGTVRRKQYHDRLGGIAQGDPISPFLSNLYLDPLDRYLEKHQIAFVRYGDDMILLEHNKEKLLQDKKLLQQQLRFLQLSLKEEKTSIAHVDDGFEYMGLFIHKHTIRIEKKRLQDKILRMEKETHPLQLPQCITLLNDKINGFRRYYEKLITDTRQTKQLQDKLDEIIIAKIIEAKQHKTITTQHAFKELLSTLQSFAYHDSKQNYNHYLSVLARAYDTIKSTKDPAKTAEEKIARKKRQILQHQTKSSELVVGRFGLYLGFSRGKATLKEHGKILKTIPINHLQRILILQTCSISSELIFQCVKRNIPIDLLKNDTPYAQIYAYRSTAHTLARKQLAIIDTTYALSIAKELLKTKIKNQINLIKYYARYRKQKYKESYMRLQHAITSMQTVYAKIDSATSTATLMGYEGSSSASYWEAFGILIKEPEYQRVTYQATDAINQALNYGYAIVYHRVQSALIKAGLDIYTSIYHTITPKKPTLVFDLIEEFRSPVVDREIISIINRGFHLSTSNGKLTSKSIQEIVRNIQERLSTPTKYRKKRHTLLEIIQLQAYRLATAIKNDARYHGYVARY